LKDQYPYIIEYLFNLGFWQVYQQIFKGLMLDKRHEEALELLELSFLSVKEIEDFLFNKRQLSLWL
jgi:hypothetical protein